MQRSYGTNLPQVAPEKIAVHIFEPWKSVDFYRPVQEETVKGLVVQ
jgi:hypothetical protein